MKISKEEVYAYREIYYEHIKPLLRVGTKDKVLDELLDLICPTYKISPLRYRELSMIDLVQRISKMNNPKIKIVTSDRQEIDTGLAETLPELLCPIRSEQGRVDRARG